MHTENIIWKCVRSVSWKQLRNINLVPEIHRRVKSAVAPSHNLLLCFLFLKAAIAARLTTVHTTTKRIIMIGDTSLTSLSNLTQLCLTRVTPAMPSARNWILFLWWNDTRTLNKESRKNH